MWGEKIYVTYINKKNSKERDRMRMIKAKDNQELRQKRHANSSTMECGMEGSHN